MTTSTITQGDGAFRRGKPAKGAIHPAEPQRLRGQGGTIQTFTAEAPERLARLLASPEKPGGDVPVWIVGMPRSGTTLVEQIPRQYERLMDHWRRVLTPNRFVEVE